MYDATGSIYTKKITDSWHIYKSLYELLYEFYFYKLLLYITINYLGKDYSNSTIGKLFFMRWSRIISDLYFLLLLLLSLFISSVCDSPRQFLPHKARQGFAQIHSRRFISLKTVQLDSSFHNITNPTFSGKIAIHVNENMTCIFIRVTTHWGLSLVVATPQCCCCTAVF